MHALVELDAVGTDVLDRRRAHGARDQRQVLQSGQAQRQRVLHETMPAVPGPGADHHAVAVVAHDLHGVVRQGQRDAFQRRGEQ